MHFLRLARATNRAVPGLRSPAQPGDEEAAGAVPIGTRQEELGPLRVRELGPLLAEWLGLEPPPVDHRLVLVGVEGADRVDDRPAGRSPPGRRSEQAGAGPGQRP